MMNRVWFITGISSGLGKGMAEAVIEKGEFVIGTFRKSSEVEAFNNLHQQNARAIQLDITEIDRIENIIHAIIEEFGKIDMLVNNAGVGFAGAIEEASMEEIRKVFEANFFGTLKLSQAVLAHMRKAMSGNIVQISSHAGVKAFAGFGIYNASKFALEGFSEALAQEVKPFGIKVCIVEPGPFRTNFAGRSLSVSEKTISAYDGTAGAFRQKLLNVHNKQEGDPVKAAQLIINHVNSDEPTLRLPLGSIPLKTIAMKIDSLQSDLDVNREVAMKAVF